MQSKLVYAERQGEKKGEQRGMRQGEKRIIELLKSGKSLEDVIKEYGND